MSFLYLLFIIILAMVAGKRSAGKKTWLYMLPLIIALSIPPALLGDSSTDHETYETTYRYISRLPSLDIDNPIEIITGKIEDQEMGFVFLERLLSLLGITSVGFFFIVALASNALFVSSYYRFKNPIIIILLFLASVQFLQEPNLVRQILAVAIIFYSLRYVEDKNWKMYLLFLFLGYMIHHSAIICVMFMPLCFEIKAHKYYFWGLLAIWSFSLLVASGVMALDLSYLDALIGLSEDYNLYLSDADVVGAGKIKFDYIYNLIIIIALLLYKDNPKFNIYFYFLVIGAALSNLTLAMPNLYRVGLYFSVTIPVMLPYIIGVAMDNKKYRVPAQVLSVFLLLYYLRFYFFNVSSFFD